MAIRIGGDSSVNQIQQNNSSTSRATQQPAVRENSAFQSAAIPQGTNSRAAARSSENISASNLRGQLQGAPPLSTITKDAASAMKPAGNGGTDSVAVTKTATPNLAILDNQTATSTIKIDGTPTDQVQSISVNVDIAHTYRGDLVVKLVSPSGKEAILTNKAGGSADNFVVSAKDLSTTFAGEKMAGDWKLVVQDTARADVGTLKSWGMSVEKKPGGNTPPPSTGPTNLQITGTAQFIQRTMTDLNKFAPGATVDAQGYVRAPATKTPGHEQGYRLLDDILAGGSGGNKKVTINFTSQNAFTSSATGATGTPTAPGAGSAATVSYDQSLDIALPTVIGKAADGTDIIADRPISSEVVLAHELVHAIHAQRGTIDRSSRDHTFTDSGVTYKENWRFEELRTTGFTGFRQGNEASENSIRAELGFGNRATYLDRSSWTRVSGAAPNAIAAGAGATSGGEQLVGDAWRSDGAALPNGQFRICNCFAC